MRKRQGSCASHRASSPGKSTNERVGSRIACVGPHGPQGNGLITQGDHECVVEPSELLKRIEVDPEVMAGKPVIRGTRIPVDLILDMLAEDVPTEEILREYPDLTRDDIRAALAYASASLKAEEVRLTP